MYFLYKAEISRSKIRKSSYPLNNIRKSSEPLLHPEGIRISNRYPFMNFLPVIPNCYKPLMDENNDNSI